MVSLELIADISPLMRLLAMGILALLYLTLAFKAYKELLLLKKHGLDSTNINTNSYITLHLIKSLGFSLMAIIAAFNFYFDGFSETRMFLTGVGLVLVYSGFAIDQKINIIFRYLIPLMIVILFLFSGHVMLLLLNLFIIILSLSLSRNSFYSKNTFFLSFFTLYFVAQLFYSFRHIAELNVIYPAGYISNTFGSLFILMWFIYRRYSSIK